MQNSADYVLRLRIDDASARFPASRAARTRASRASTADRCPSTTFSAASIACSCSMPRTGQSVAESTSKASFAVRTVTGPPGPESSTGCSNSIAIVRPRLPRTGSGTARGLAVAPGPAGEVRAPASARAWGSARSRGSRCALTGTAWSSGGWPCRHSFLEGLSHPVNRAFAVRFRKVAAAG